MSLSHRDVFPALAVPLVGILGATTVLVLMGAMAADRSSLAVGACSLGLLVVVRSARAWSSRPRRVLAGLACLGLAIGLAKGGRAAWPPALRNLPKLFAASVTDMPPRMVPCGEVGRRFDRLALTEARLRFPDETVALVHRCYGYEGGSTVEVRLRIGRFLAPKRETQLVVGEKVTLDRDTGRPRFSPYANEQAAEADLPRLDATEAVRERMGDVSRLCFLDGGYPGFNLGWWLDCEPTADLGPVAQVPTGWPQPTFARGCDGSELRDSPCFQVQVAEPDSGRSLDDFSSTDDSGD